MPLCWLFTFQRGEPIIGEATDAAEPTDNEIKWIKLVVGVLFVLLGLKQWMSRPKGNDVPKFPKWMASIDNFSAARSFGFAVLLSINPKNLALVIVAIGAVTQLDLTTSDELVAVATFTAIASLTVVTSVVAYVIAQARVSIALDAIKEFMTKHNSVIMSIVFFALGTMLIIDSI